MAFAGDPLLIYSIMAVDDDSGKESPFQGFGRSFQSLGWAFRAIARMPADVLENSQDLREVVAQRMGGWRSLAWLPLMVSVIEEFDRDDLGVFVVILSGDEAIAARVQQWSREFADSILHVSTVAGVGALLAEDFDQARLQAYCMERLEAAKAKMSADRYAAASTALQNWMRREATQIDLPSDGHNVLEPNQMVLERAGLKLSEGKPFMGRDEREYARAILASCEAVMAVRQDVGLRPYHAMTLYPPDLILTEPALFRHAYRASRPGESDEDRAGSQVLKMLRQQKGLVTQARSDFPELLNRSPLARGLLRARQFELETHTLAVGLKAAETCSAVMRLSPGVNHVFADLSAFARSVRSEKPEAGRKARRLFETIQAKLVDAIGQDRLAFIADQGPAIKIVADAPLEWLPIGDLPLSLRMNVSRVNATPGNVMLGQMVTPRAVRFTPVELQKVLIVSSFEAHDPLRLMMVRSVMAIRQRWVGKVDVTFKVVETRAQLIHVLNEYDGHILVFDGHGSANDTKLVGTLRVGQEDIDVWSLRGVARIPMIVILSACDTHGIDSSSHATVGNGMLAWGARSVLATMLPVGGQSSAAFVARLIYRLADFLPAALSANKRVLNWTEVVSGMLRMLLASELLDRLVGPPALPTEPRGKIQLAANNDINSYHPEWFDRLLSSIAAHRNEDLGSVRSRAKGVIARSEAIRYVQLGNPESILIDDGSIMRKFVPDGLITPLGEGLPNEPRKLSD